MRVYTVYDEVAEESGPLYEAVNDSVALRKFRQLLQQVSPTDQDAFKLYYLGSYDRNVMRLVVVDDPVNVVLPKDLPTLMEGHDA